jgi:hypothetical protein
MEKGSKPCMETDGLGTCHGLNEMVIYLAKSAQYIHLSFRDSWSLSHLMVEGVCSVMQLL